jgi:hypothetical protein
LLSFVPNATRSAANVFGFFSGVFGISPMGVSAESLPKLAQIYLFGAVYFVLPGPPRVEAAEVVTRRRMRIAGPGCPTRTGLVRSSTYSW